MPVAESVAENNLEWDNDVAFADFDQVRDPIDILSESVSLRVPTKPVLVVLIGRVVDALNSFEIVLNCNEPE